MPRSVTSTSSSAGASASTSDITSESNSLVASVGAACVANHNFFGIGYEIIVRAFNRFVQKVGSCFC